MPEAPSPPRRAQARRATRETQVEVELDLDTPGMPAAATGLGMLDHMLEQLGLHSGWTLTVRAQGDLHVDTHHLVEDTGMVVGEALAQALGDRQGLTRYGEARLPMDEALVAVAVDLGGRSHVEWAGAWPPYPAGGVYPDVWPEFFRALARTARLTVHVELVRGNSAHHAVEAAFKALARALGQAVRPDPLGRGVSTKGRVDL